MMVEQHPGTSEEHTDGMEWPWRGGGRQQCILACDKSVGVHSCPRQGKHELHWLPKPEHQHAAKGIMDASQGRAPSHIHARH